MKGSVWYRELTDIIGIIDGDIFVAENGDMKIECEIADHDWMHKFLTDNGYVYIGEL